MLNLPSSANSKLWKLRHDTPSIQGMPETENQFHGTEFII